MQFGPRKTGNEPPSDGNKPPQFRIPGWVTTAILLLALLWFFSRLPFIMDGLSSEQPIQVPYSFLYQQAAEGNVDTVQVQDNIAAGAFNSVVTYPPDGSDEIQQGVEQQSSRRFEATIPLTDEALLEQLRNNGATIVYQPTEVSPILLFLVNFGPLLLLVGFFIWQARRAQGQAGNVFGFGRSQAREYNAERPQVTFTDVAGQDAAKSELVEIVDFLREPDKYVALGARIPRGVLLVGPPGTGKTLMARAVAGEAKVAFFSLAASEFVEMFVGVGASRVRDLFKRAKDHAPSIIFIDEIDAVGRRRGAGMGGGHDEREQTLNQMLAEMDGFDQAESVIVMAATNRPDVLDPALLRPGRFDRQVTVALPDKNGREAILKIHARGKPMAEDVSLSDLAKATIGFSGADLSNLANEAALTAARRSSKKITSLDFAEAFDRIVLGIKSPPLSNERERRLTAYHEAGHALVASLTPKSDPIFKVTIVPRGQALGVTWYLPEDDKRSRTKGELIARILVGLGGRAAEEIVLDDITTGAVGDIRQITDMARRMVMQFGMSDAIGLVNLNNEDQQPFLGYSMTQEKHYSEETAAKVDVEVKRIIDEAYHHVLNLLRDNRDKLEALAQELLTTEVVERARLLELIGVPPGIEEPEVTNA